MSLPQGATTFLFTDIEGSTRLWEQHPEAMRLALARHDALMRQAIEAHGGQVFKTMGDAFYAAFATVPQAVGAAFAAQRLLLAETWPEAVVLRVRMAIHAGIAEQRDADYFGQPLNRVARLLSAGHGGQVLLSQAAHDLVQERMPTGASLRHLGEHRLRDLGRREPIFQLLHPDLPSQFPALRSLSNPDLPNNLPQQLTSFIGREKEMAEIKALLRHTPLLTLTGSGGGGKTRLALQVAADLLEEYPDGVWLAELAPLTDPDLVARTVATVLGVEEQAGRTPTQALLERLKTQKLLLLLDNCEHLLSACAYLADALLRACPGVKILASSREAMGISGETVYRIPTLSLPEPSPITHPGELSGYEATRLFADRATAALPAFSVTPQNASALVSVCRHLDGIPLAIELAAARVRSLSLEEIDSRLDNRFRLLTGGSKTALPRQQTLAAAIDWSYDLLTETERLLLARLSVFAGGWTLEAAEAVGAGEEIDDWEVLDLLTSLADKSLVQVEIGEAHSRYRLLETMRQYAQDRLESTAEGHQVRAAHRDYFLAWVETARQQLNGPEQGEWLEALEEEHDNLRQALRFCRENPGEGAVGLHLSSALQQFWWTHMHLREGREQLETFLVQTADAEPNGARADALNGVGVLSWRQADYVGARQAYSESLQISRRLGNKVGAGNALNNLGNVALMQGDYAAAADFYQESLTLRRESGDRHGIAYSLGNLGIVKETQGDYPAARALYEEGLALRRELGDRQSIANALNNLGNVMKALGDRPSARAMHEESLAIRRDLGDRQGVAISLGNLGNVLLEQGEYAQAQRLHEEALLMKQELEDRLGIADSLAAFASLAVKANQEERAVRLWGAATALYEAVGSPLLPEDQKTLDREITEARARLGETAYAQAWEEGSALTPEQAILYALPKQRL